MYSYGVMHGLHFQRPPYASNKLVRCVKGVVLDVAVDICKVDPLMESIWRLNLAEDNLRQFFVHRDLAHITVSYF